MNIVPSSRPVFKKENLLKTFRYFFGETFTKYPVIIFAIRPNTNRVNFYDDEMVVYNTGSDSFKSFNFNTDPSAYVMKGESKAVLKLGVHFFKYSYHHKYNDAKRYQALRPNTPNEYVPVWRINKNGKGFYSSIGQAIDIHKGGLNSTWSEGCQTVYFGQYLEFLRAVGEPLGIQNITDKIQPRPNTPIYNGIGNIPYILIEQKDYDYIQSLSENEFDSPLDIAYQAKRFVNVPKIQTTKPKEEIVSNGEQILKVIETEVSELTGPIETEENSTRVVFSEPENLPSAENLPEGKEESTPESETVPTKAPAPQGVSETFRSWMNWLIGLPLIGSLVLAVQNYFVSGQFDVTAVIVPFLEFLKTIFPNLVWLIGFYTAYKTITGWKKQQSFQKQMEINSDKLKNSIEVIPDEVTQSVIDKCKTKITGIFG